MQVSNLRYAAQDDMSVNCDFAHPEYGIIPTTIRLDGVDSDPLIVSAVLEKVDEIQPYIDPNDSVEFRESVAKVARDNAVNADLYVVELGVTVQYNKQSREVISSILSDNTLVDSVVERWRLADNTWIDLTIADLRLIVKKGGERRRTVWAQYAEWDSGDKSVQFEVTL